MSLDLRTIENPDYESGLKISVVIENFGCGKCPETGRDDQGTLTIVYTPNTQIAECYSLRNFVRELGGATKYQEAFLHDLYCALSEALSPQALYVEFASRRRWHTELDANPVGYTLSRGRR